MRRSLLVVACRRSGVSGDAIDECGWKYDCCAAAAVDSAFRPSAVSLGVDNEFR